MAVNGVTNTVSSVYSAPKGNSSLDKDDFLRLLVTQLKYQDPLNPMEDREFIAQTAQFSALEQMTNINQNFSQFMRMQAISNTAALIGKEVSYMITKEDEEEVQTLSGLVTEVKFANGTVYLYINGEEVPMEMMVGIKDPASEGNSSTGGDDSSEGDTSTEEDNQ